MPLDLDSSKNPNLHRINLHSLLGTQLKQPFGLEKNQTLAKYYCFKTFRHSIVQNDATQVLNISSLAVEN